MAALSKLIFVSLMLVYGQEYLQIARPAIVIDGLVIILAGCYLVAVHLQRPDA